MSTIKITLLSLFLCTIFFQFAAAQSCGCDHTLANLSTTNVNIINASSFSYAPGDVFCIQADSIAGLRFIGFEGTAAQPLIFKNCGGKVVINASSYSGIAFRQSRFIRLTGTGDSQHEYGIEVAQTPNGTMGTEVSYLSSDFELDHLEIHDVGFAGIMAKTDPSCNDSLTWRRNGYVLRNLNIHHNFIHDTEGEGMYLGYTGGYKVTSNKICNGDTMFGHWLENVDVHHNIVENTGWDAIQLNLGQGDCRVRDNWVRNPGKNNVTFQNFAMSIGGGVYQIYNNYIFNDPGMPGKGMQMISGESGSLLYNNVFIDLNGHTMFLHNRHKYDDPAMGYGIFNNTIVRPLGSAVMYNSTIVTSANPNEVGQQQDDVPMYFHNNLVSNPDCDYQNQNFWKKEPECYFDFNNKSTRDSSLARISHNLTTRALDTLALVDTLNLDFAPLNLASPLVDAGLDVSGFGVTFDHNNDLRPFGGLFDIGAFEYSPALSVQAPAGGLKLSPNPTSGVVRIEATEALVAVTAYDVLGHRGLLEVNAGQVDLSGLPAGVYWLRVELVGGAVFVKKVLRR